MEYLPGAKSRSSPQFLGFTEAAVVLGAVVVLFALFVVIQFQYFFGGQTNIGVQGYTYSEYARRGFGELGGGGLLQPAALPGPERHRQAPEGSPAPGLLRAGHRHGGRWWA